MSIRPAEPSDMEALAALLRQAHAREAARAIRVDEPKARHLLMHHIVHRQTFSWVSEGVGGALFGELTQPWYSREYVASDLFFYAQDASGLPLLRAFIDWSRRMGAVAMMLSQTSGIKIERTSRLYRRLGFERIGHVHTMRLK